MFMGDCCMARLFKNGQKHALSSKILTAAADKAFNKMYSNTPNSLLMEKGDVQCTRWLGPVRHPAPK